MVKITELKENDYGDIEGKIFLNCISEKIKIVYNKEFSFNYVNTIIDQFEKVYPKIIDTLCKYTVDYCKDFINEYPDIEYKSGLKSLKKRIDILNYISFYSLRLELDNGKPVFNFYCTCDWSEEEDLQWIIKDENIIYVGPWYDFGPSSPGLNNPFFNYCIRS